MSDFDNTNRGVAYTNDYKSGDKHPDYKGKGNFNGTDFEFGIWKNEGPKGPYFSFSFSEPYVKQEQQEQSGYEKAKQVASDLRTEEPININDIPF